MDEPPTADPAPEPSHIRPILSERAAKPRAGRTGVGAAGLLLLGAWLALRFFGGGLAAALAEPSLNLMRAALGGATVGLLGLAALLSPTRPPLRLPPPLVLFGALVWVALSGASAQWAIVPRSAWLVSVHALEDLLLLIAIWWVASADRAARRRLLAVFLACAAAAGALGVRERVRDRPRARAAYRADPSLGDVSPELRRDLESRLFAEQASGPFVLPNGLGAFCVAGALAALGATLSLGGAWRLAPGLVAALCLAGVWASAQKGPVLAAALGLLVGGAWLAWGRRQRLSRVLSALALAGAVGLPIVILVTPSPTLERVPGGLSLAVRHEYARAAARLVAEAPARGIGRGQLVHHYGRVRAVRSESTRLVHNEWLEALVETGPLGLAGFGALWIGLLIAAWRGARSSSPHGDDGEGGAGQEGPGAEPSAARSTPLVAGLAMGAASLIVCGLPYRSPATVLPLALGLAVFAAGLHRGLAAARGPWLAAGAIAALAALLAQTGFDFVLHEPGIGGGLMLVAGALATGGATRTSGGARAPRWAVVAITTLGLVTAVGLDLFALPPQLERETLHQELEAAARRGDAPGSLRSGAALLAADPQDASAAAAIADLYARRWRARRTLADLEAALALLRRATGSARADLAALWTQRGELLLSAARSGEAVQVLRKGTARSPVAARLRLVLARALAREGRHAEAAREARHALERSAATRSFAERLSAKDLAEARSLAGP